MIVASALQHEGPSAADAADAASFRDETDARHWHRQVRSVDLIRVRRTARSATRLLGAASNAAIVVWGWGIAQYHYSLPQSLTIAAREGGPATLQWLVIVVVAAVLLVIPALVLVFRLDQHSRLEVNPLEVQT